MRATKPKKTRARDMLQKKIYPQKLSIDKNKALERTFKGYRGL